MQNQAGMDVAKIIEGFRRAKAALGRRRMPPQGGVVPRGRIFLRVREHGHVVREVVEDNFFTLYGMETILYSFRWAGSGQYVVIFDDANIPPGSIPLDDLDIVSDGFDSKVADNPSPVFDDNGPLVKFGSFSFGTYPANHNIVGVGIKSDADPGFPVAWSLQSFVPLTTPVQMTANVTFLDLVYQVRLERVA